MDIYFYIQVALDTLATLDATLYPNLHYYCTKTSVFRHLDALLRLFQSKDKPVVYIEDKAYFLFAQKYIRQWSKMVQECGGCTESWQSHKVFWIDLGLIQTFVATDSSENPVLKSIWERASVRRYRSETLWTVPLYDETLLQRAESIAALYREWHINVTHLRKNVIIRFRGQERANWLYWPDYHVIGQDERLMLSYCHEAIRTAVEAKGYTTFAEMETMVHSFCIERLYFQPQPLSPEEAERQQPYWGILNMILQEKALLCHEVGCEYRQIRKTDRQELSLPENLKSWLIVPK